MSLTKNLKISLSDLKTPTEIKQFNFLITNFAKKAFIHG